MSSNNKEAKWAWKAITLTWLVETDSEISDARFKVKKEEKKYEVQQG